MNQGTLPTRPFSLLIKPACADCNLRCEYCFYLDHADLYPETGTHRMSRRVLKRMIASYMETDQAHYAFGWQGGEPTLMGLDFFERVTSLQQKYGKSGSSVANGLQTNATLIDDAFAKHLRKYNFLVGVSLDGPAEIHDKSRVYAGGRGSHSDVLKGIDHLARNGVDFNILTLVSQANVRKGREVYRYLCDNGFLYHQYIECADFDRDGDLAPYAISGPEWGDFLCSVFDEWIKADTRRVSIRLFDSILVMLVDGIANVCQMGTTCREYFVVEHNGDIYPCDFFVEPGLKLGNIETNSWDELLASPLYAEFGRRKAAWNARCADCDYVKFCAGDCPRKRFRSGTDPSQISELCAGWRQFYSHSLDTFRELSTDIKRERLGLA